MGKGRIFGSIALLVCVVAAASWSGCGNSNDQGISFRSLGFFASGPPPNPPAGDAGRCASLTSDTQVPQIAPDGSLQGGFLGLQNNMNQGINLDHVDLLYSVNGSRLAIPNDVFAVTDRLGPASGQESSTSTVFQQILIVSPNIFKFLNDNRSRLPDLPFSMVVQATAVGTADSGDVFRTNRSTYEVNFVDGTCIAPTPGPTATPPIA